MKRKTRKLRRKNCFWYSLFQWEPENISFWYFLCQGESEGICFWYSLCQGRSDWFLFGILFVKGNQKRIVLVFSLSRGIRKDLFLVFSFPDKSLHKGISTPSFLSEYLKVFPRRQNFFSRQAFQIMCLFIWSFFY